MKEVDPLTFLKAVYMNAELPLSVRMRAAIVSGNSDGVRAGFCDCAGSEVEAN